MLGIRQAKQRERQKVQPGPNLMIESLRVKNFRAFEDLSLSGLGRLNVLVGRNASGKTALLESIFLGLGGNPGLVGNFRAWRGLGPMPVIQRTRRAYEELWNDTFFQLDTSRTVEISIEGHPESKRSLKFYYSPEAAIGTTFPVSGTGTGEKLNGSSSATTSKPAVTPGDSSLIVPIVFEFTDTGATAHFKLDLNAAGFLNATIISATGGRVPAAAPSAFYSSGFIGAFNPQEAATQYSDLSKAEKEDHFLQLLREVYPEIQKLSHELNAGISMMYCKLANMDMKLPVGMVSGGMYKLLAILLGIASARKGVILVDELENGFYYEALPKIWELLHSFATEFEVQVFASTHSRECLLALSQAITGHEEDFRLLRPERDNGTQTVRIFPGENFRAALETDIDVR